MPFVGIMGFYFNTSNLIAAAMNIAYLLWTKFLADAERANIRKVRDFVISVEGKYNVSKNLCQTGLILNELQGLNMEILVPSLAYIFVDDKEALTSLPLKPSLQPI